jgi:hypothetical protein
VRGDFEAQGFAVFPDVVTEPECEAISTAVSGDPSVAVTSRKWLSEPWCHDLAASLSRNVALSGVFSSTFVPVQCTLFEKSPRKNWLVSLHQDLSIPVRERVRSGELSGWSVKDDALFVQPPPRVLESLVALRVHLDDCEPETGALRVVPGSHRFGRLDSTRALALREANGETTPSVKRGGILAMRPLLLHASSKATIPSRRRVLHFVFGPPSLPLGLTWADAPSRDIELPRRV